MIILILIVAFFVITITLVMIDTVQSRGEKRILIDKKIPYKIKDILVLGIGKGRKETDYEILLDRVITAAELNKENVDNYNIIFDNSSCSIYECIYKIKEELKIESMIIITNEYQLPRALYLAEKMGINAYGIKSDLRDYEDIEIYRDRELFAQVKDFIYINILKPKSKK